jgi:hypothetical protein
MNNERIVQLYDPTCMLKIDQQIARGFVVLMAGAAADASSGEASGKKKKKKNKIERTALELGFMAITDGNVVETCFGVSTSPVAASMRESAASKHARNVKLLLSEAADSNEQIPRIAVLTYQQAFRVVVHFHDEIAKLNFFTSCFKYGRIQHDAQEALRVTFQQLTSAVESTM